MKFSALCQDMFGGRLAGHCEEPVRSRFLTCEVSHIIS